MTDQAPTTEEVEFAYWMYTNLGQYGRRGMKHPEFRAWLDAHDREVAARAWGEGFSAGDEYGYKCGNDDGFGVGPNEDDEPSNPYRANPTFATPGTGSPQDTE